jgi:GntR family transcriptional regulator
VRWHVDFHSGVPVYLQLLEQVKTAVATGTLRAQDQLPSVRALAEELRINRNTIAKAYAEMETQGLVESRQGLGVFVTQASTPLKKAVRTERLAELVDALVVQAHHLQLSDETLKGLLDERLRKFHAQRADNDAVPPEDAWRRRSS